ncbi:hypothetical protein ACJMK2_003947 [Sinanodonta woodiana]|uniref:Uncharacterized protein n=1 Tax=Sinanodonta woodiana TaxID=1069815 RepID=A0ABD3Y2I5_SINWO
MNLSKTPMKIAGAACGVVSIVLGIAAIALPKWLSYDADLAEIGYGLWSACAFIPAQSHVVCTPYTKTADWVKATAALEVVGICVIALAVALAFLHIFIAKNNKVAGKLPGPIAIVGGMLMIVGVIVWAVKFKAEPSLELLSLSAGFILAIVSAIMSFIAGILFFLGWIAESRGQTHMVV